MVEYKAVANGTRQELGVEYKAAPNGRIRGCIQYKIQDSSQL